MDHLESGVVPGCNVTVAEASAVVVVPRPAAAGCEPRIEVVRDGDVIQAIDVTCACGRKMRLRCVYDGDKAPLAPVLGGEG
jgi:hypothetical protein